MNPDISLYIHIPFCRRKCNYCSFVSYPHRENDIPAYVSALKREMALRSTGQRVRTVYFGGGTPSLLSAEQVAGVLSYARSLFAVDEAAEITLEANPGTVDEAYLSDIRASGVNRLSIGVQSLDDGELALLGRIHTAAEAKDAVDCARSAGFINLSIDLIYGLPGQTPASWQNTLERAVELSPEHISLYSLTLEGKIPMRLAIERGETPGPDPDCAAEQYELAEDSLATQGYRHYEISNWAREGYECRHNIVYWRTMPYLGIGVAAHSYMDGRRCANTADLDDYVNALSRNIAPPESLVEEISTELQLSEAVIMGLRLCQGISIDDIRSRFDVDLLERYKAQVDALAELGLLEQTEGHIRLTRRGRLLGNEVFWRFLPE